MFLTESEVAALTGYESQAGQRRWLANHGWTFVVSSKGRPMVSRSHAEARLAGAALGPKRAWAPNLEAFAGKS